MSYPIFTLVLGRTNTGKTTFIHEVLVKKYIQSCNRVLIVTPHPQEWQNVELVDTGKKSFFKYSGIKRTIANIDIIKNLNDEINFYRNGLLVFEDLRFFIDSKITRDLEQLFISLDQRKIDIIGAAHGFTRVPPIFFTYASDIVLFKTKDNIKNRKNVINEDDYDNLHAMQMRVNANADYHYREFYNIIS